MGLKKMSNTSNQGKGLNGMEVMVLICFCPGRHERQRQWGRLSKRDLIKIVASYNRDPTVLKDRIRVNPYHSATRFNLVGILLQKKNLPQWSPRTTPRSTNLVVQIIV